MTNVSHRVGDLMTGKAVFVDKSKSLAFAIETMNRQQLSWLPVVDDQKKLCGVLSIKDLLPLTYSLQCDVAVLDSVSDLVRRILTDVLVQDNDDRKVSEFMTSSVETTRPDELVSDAARKLLDNAIHHLPVVDSADRVIGILSTMDIIRAVASLDELPV